MSNLIRNNGTALKKTASYYILHLLVAAGVAWLVTGSLAMAMALSLLEPTVQAFAYFGHEKAWAKVVLPFKALAKTVTYYIMHITVAACVTFALTGDLLASLTLSLLEPTVQMVVFYFHEKFWTNKTAHTSCAAVAAV